MTVDLAEFIEARYAEAEALAREGHPWDLDPRTGQWTAYGHHPGPADRRQDRDVQMVGTETGETGWTVCEVGQFDRAPKIAAYIASVDPAHRLADLRLKRAILALHAAVGVTGDYPRERPYCGSCGEWAPCATVRQLGTEFAGHPEYRPEWRPEA